MMAQDDIDAAYPFLVREVPRPRFLGQGRNCSFSPEHSERIRDRLRALEPATGAMFHAKPPDASPPFRLLINKLLEHDDSLRSFVALSYCWHPIMGCPLGQWEPVSGCELGASQYHKHLPISDRCFTEVLANLLQPVEGIWIDQLSIDQDDEKEKAEAIASMDLVYKNARLVIIVLEDVELTESESSVARSLRYHGQRNEPDAFKSVLKTSPHVVRDLVCKIGSSRWFLRAWCSHEFYLCQDAAFVIPCYEQRSALSLGLAALQDILMLKSDWLPASVDSWAGRLNGYRTALRLLSTRFVIFWQQLPSPPIYGICYQVNDLQASRGCDKVSIALNLLGLPLSFRGRVRSEAHSRHILTLLALASGDPLMLCCTGDPLDTSTWSKRERRRRRRRRRRPNLDMSCLQWPDLGDLVHVNNRYPKAVPALCDAIRLEGGRMLVEVFDMQKMMNNGLPSAADIGRARSLLGALLEQDPDMMAKLEPEEFTNTVLNRDEFFNNSVSYLACAIHLGPAWISDIFSNIGHSPSAQGLRVCLKTNFGDAFTRIVKQHFGSITTTANTATEDGSTTTTTFADFIPFALQHVLQLGSTARRITCTTTTSSWSNSSSNSGTLGGGAIVALPIDYNPEELVAVVPAALVGQGHSFIKRLWLLEKKNMKRAGGLAKATACRIRGKGYIWGYKEMVDKRWWAPISM